MATRHLARSIVLQSFYEWDFYNKKPDLTEIIERNMKEFGVGIDEPEFVWKIVKGVIDHLKEFDKIIEKYEKDADFRQKTKISVNDLPKFTQDCAEWLSGFGNLELVGIDSLTVGNKIIHSAFLEKDILLVEGLFLEKAPENFVLHCFPWKLKLVNGAPCRAIALI